VNDTDPAAAAPALADAVERGRYAIYQTSDGGYVVARAVDLCDSCLGCDCGNRAAQLEAPGWAVKLMAGAGSPAGMLKAARAMIRRNTAGEPEGAPDGQ